MHPASLEHMRRLRREHLAYLAALPAPMICDDGGFCNTPDKSYRSIFADLPGLDYHSCDIVAHKSVRHVKPDPFTLPFPDEHFDLVVSGQMLEHCQNPFRAVAEMKRVLKVGSCLAIIVPSTGPRHDAQDGWRFQHDAFTFIRREVGGLKTIVDFIDPSNNEDTRAAKWHDHVWLARRV
jgi:SAM-dependent methyltransferase